MKTEQIKVDGMSCGHCVETIENSVGKMEGVKQVIVIARRQKSFS